MPRIVISLTDGQKDLWVGAAHDERVTLSEWVRRAADARAGALVAGEGEAVVPIGAQPGAASRDLRPSPATSARPFRGPDPKGGGKVKRGLGSGEVLPVPPPVAGLVSPVPSPLADEGRGGPARGRTSDVVASRRSAAGSFRPDPKKKQ